MNEHQFGKFVESDVVNFMQKHELKSIMVDDGTQKATLKVNHDGDIKVNYSSKKTL